MKYVWVCLLVFLNFTVLSEESVSEESVSEEKEGYVICDWDDPDNCCEVNDFVTKSLNWKYGTKQFFKCTLSYLLGSSEEDHNECRRLVGNEFWEKFEEHVNKVCDFW